MGHNAGWFHLVGKTPAEVAETLMRTCSSAGALLGQTAEDVERALASGGHGVALIPSEGGTAVYTTHDSGYTPDLALAHLLAHALETAALVSYVLDVALCAGLGVVGPASNVSAVRRAFDAGELEIPASPLGEGAFRSAHDVPAGAAFVFAVASSPAAAESEWGAFFAVAKPDRFLLEDIRDEEPDSTEEDEVPSARIEPEEPEFTESPPPRREPGCLGAINATCRYHAQLEKIERWILHWGITSSSPTRWLLHAHAPEGALVLRVDASGERPSLAWYSLLEAVVRAVDAATSKVAFAQLRGPLKTQRTTFVLTPDLEFQQAREVIFIPKLKQKKGQPTDPAQLEELVRHARSAGIVVHPANPGALPR